MKQFLEFIPLIIFFIIYKMNPQIISVGHYSFMIGGIFSATTILMITSIIIYSIYFITQGYTLDNKQLFGCLACIIFCSLTLFFHQEKILMWKVPIVNGLFALMFTASHFVSDKPLIKKIMSNSNIELPNKIWKLLNISWIIFFLICGGSNLFVSLYFKEIWVDFKVFGSLAMTILFLLGQSIFLAMYFYKNKK